MTCNECTVASKCKQHCLYFDAAVQSAVVCVYILMTFRAQMIRRRLEKHLEMGSSCFSRHHDNRSTFNAVIIFPLHFVFSSRYHSDILSKQMKTFFNLFLRILMYLSGLFAVRSHLDCPKGKPMRKNSPFRH